MAWEAKDQANPSHLRRSTQKNLATKTRRIQKLLVANRGEIALRVMRSAREMGISTVAVYSEADRNAPFVRFADEAVCIGPAPSKESYLVFDKIIKVCADLKVDAVHPGYGFLSENGDFCRALEKAGVIFVGPSPHAMKVMGDKLAAKEAVKGHGVPLVPGTEGAVSGLDEAIKVAKTITFPILIKAAAGGGGKGMRIVEKESELKEGLERAISEAQNAFGDGSVFRGPFVNDVQKGPGELTFKDGRKITGEFLDHMPNGQAVEQSNAGTLNGVWSNGMLNGKVLVTYPNGTRFEGMYASNKRNGIGTDFLSDGSREECNWVNDVRQSPCVRITPDGKRIEYKAPPARRN